MANQFRGNPGEEVSWSNGLTTVLLARVAVAAAELWNTDWERDFARWIATRDQNRLPLGSTGFDLSDIPWGSTAEEFDANRRFVVEVVVFAASDEVANLLPYYPNPDREAAHRESLRALALLVHHFDRANAAPSEWSYFIPPTNSVCGEHRIFCHASGCMACPDEVHARPSESQTPGCGPAHRESSCGCFQRRFL